MIRVHYKRTPADDAGWDQYVNSHPLASVYHLTNWQRIIERTYKLQSIYLIAERTHGRSEQKAPGPDSGGPITGVLPFFHMKSIFFGHNLVSMPFVDYAGLLYSDRQSYDALIKEACDLKERLKVPEIELRQNYQDHDVSAPQNETGMRFASNDDKFSMKLKLPGSSEELMTSFKSKLRSQIKSSFKKGLETVVGGKELLDDFYTVFSVNMRDLGSPVHSKAMIKNLLDELPETTRLFVVYQDETPLACSAVVGFRKSLENPWASSLRKYSRLNANMQLYWKMLEYGCDNGYEIFNFGRSSKDQGTYKFKKQWGAEPSALYWMVGRGSDITPDFQVKPDPKEKLGVLIRAWQRLPVPITRVLGPMIRKRISL